jgi:hypothetical protein
MNHAQASRITEDSLLAETLDVVHPERAVVGDVAGVALHDPLSPR